jgi:hypothetical protein
MNYKTIPSSLLLIIVAIGLSGCIHIGDTTEVIPPSDYTQQPISTGVFDPMAALTGTPRPPSSDTGSYQITLSNQSNWDVCYVYIAQSADLSWGSDRLSKDEQVAHGESKEISIKPGTYDLRVENCDFMRLDEQSNVTISGDYSWQVNDPNEIFYEDFKGDTSRWIPPQAPNGKGIVADSALTLTSARKDTLALETYPQNVQNSTNVIETIAHQTASGDSAAYGLMCRVQPNGDGYLFLVRSDEQFSIQKVSGGKWTPLIDWQSNPNVTYYTDFNVLEITCNDTALSLRFNGLTLFKANDNDFTSGNFGIAAVTFIDKSAEYTFNNLAVIEP